jgi:GDP-D-mannose 3',5'-epimerase
VVLTSRLDSDLGFGHLETYVRALILGSEGHLGRSLTRRLRDDGFYVCGVDRKPNEVPVDSYACRDLLHDDIQDLLEGTDFVFVLAALVGGILFSSSHDKKIRDWNTKVFQNIANQLARIPESKTVIFLSSQAVYEKVDSRPFKETSPELLPKPKTGYGTSKVFGEILFRDLGEKSHRVVILRPSNLFGNPLFPSPSNYGIRHAIPDLFSKICYAQEGTIEIYGDGNQMRSYLHIEDLVEACVIVSSLSRVKVEIVNVCGDEVYTVKQLGEMIWAAMERHGPLRFVSLPALENDFPKLYSSNHRIRSIYGWWPRKSLYEWIRSEAELLRTKFKFG